VAPLLTGYVSVDHSARLIRNYRYVVERAMRALGGWIALTPDVSAKLLMGRHVWDLAQHAEAFGGRLPELRAPGQVSQPANERVVAFMDALEEPEAPQQTVERLVGIYRVLKPHLWATYHDYLLHANAVYEPPTRRILSRCIDDERRHITAGETIISHLCSTPALTARALAWQRGLEGLLAAAGGVTGDGLPPVPRDTSEVPVETSDDAREFIRLEKPTASWPLADDLRAALDSFADSLLAQNRAALARWLAAGGSPDPACLALGAATLTSHRLIAVARLGHQRLVKWRLEGPDVSVTVLSRWAPGPEGWRVVMLDVGHIEAPGTAHPRH
jgi:hypothetical protein